MTSHSQQLHLTSQELTYLPGFLAPRAACCLLEHWLSSGAVEEHIAHLTVLAN